MRAGLFCAFILGSALFASSGCAPQQILRGQRFVTVGDGPEKSVKSIKRKNPDRPGYYDDVIRVCDVDQQGQDQNCVDTVIVQKVVQ